MAGPVPAGLAGVLVAVLLDLVLRLAVVLPLAVVLRLAAVLRLAVLRLAVLLRPAVVLRLGVLARPAGRAAARGGAAAWGAGPAGGRAAAGRAAPAGLALPVPAAALLLAVLRLAGLLPPLAVLLRLAEPALRLVLLRLAAPVLRLAVVLVPWRADPVFLAGVAGFSGCVISFLPPSRAYPGQGRCPLRTHTHLPRRPARHPWGMTTIGGRPASLARTAFDTGPTGGLRMPAPIEDYALVGDLHTAALISRDGSIDWLCLPRFDSEACFAALLGDERNGHWQIAPASGVSRVRRRYLPGTLVLETEFATASGTVRVADCMPVRGSRPGADPAGRGGDRPG